MRWQIATILKLDGKNKALAVLDLPDIHTLDTDGFSTQLVGYLLSNSLTTVLHDDDRFMIHNPTKIIVSLHALTSRVVWHVTEKGWSSDFPPLPSAFSGKYPMA